MENKKKEEDIRRKEKKTERARVVAEVLLTALTTQAKRLDQNRLESVNWSPHFLVFFLCFSFLSFFPFFNAIHVAPPEDTNTAHKVRQSQVKCMICHYPARFHGSPPRG